MIRLAIADDHAVVRRGMRQIVAEGGDIEIVGEAADYAELVALLRRHACDVLLLDIAMPGKNGIEILKSVRALYPRLRVLVLSMYPEELYALRALRAGAAGYLTKSSAPEKLLEAIRQVAAGRRFITPQLAEALAERIADPAERAPHETLTDREFQVLRLLAAGRKLSEVAAELSLSPKTVSVYRARVLEKLRVRTNAELARYALEHGLIE
ncbi:MAG: response regulator transcription factor [Burkholderiales bacterium]|nr:response regulator transcription factor [Burkholderiales bacterium]MDW8468029.1 response regulator transcription factor [Burkholderiales bacterium]